MGGLIDCNPFPMDAFAERVLVKEPQTEVGADMDLRDILEIPGDMIKKFIALIPGLNEEERREGYEYLSGIEGLEKHLVDMAHDLNFEGPATDADYTKLMNQEATPKVTEIISRKRRGTPGTEVVNKKPRVEDRYAIVNRHSRHTDGFYTGNKNFMISDPDGFGESERPVIIIVNGCKGIHFDNNDKKDDSVDDNEEDNEDDNEE